jgi:sulfatase maturation enzyme AslB (radical SAM superfamily)
MLLDKKKAEWLIDHQVAVRISYDGAGALSDTIRKTHTGQGSSNRVLSAIELLCSHPEFREWTVLNTVTTINLANMLPFVLELQEMGVPSVQFQPVRLQGAAAGSAHMAVGGTSYAERIVDIARAIVDGRINKIRVQTILGLLDPLLTGRGSQGACGS